MGLAHSPKTITDGLVFAYDMANVNKSWKGKPTENLIAISGSDASIVRSGVGYSYYGVNINTAVQSRWTSVNNQLTLSFEGKRDYSVGGTGGGNDGYPQAYVYFSDWSWAVAVGVDTYSWSRNSVSFTMPDPTGKTVIFDIYHMNAGNPGFSYSRNHQVEFSTYATPFVNGTRTTTQALLDLTKQNTITATSLTYNSNNTFSFDGTNNYAPIGTTGFPFGSSPGTLSVWCKTNTITGGWSFAISYGTAGTGTSRFLGINGSTFYFGGYGGVDISASGVPLNTWFNMVGVYDGTNAFMYINGALVSGPTARSWNTVANNAQIGRQTNSIEYWNGTIDKALVYNVALTAAEIQQNFNAHRGRYGI